MNEDALWVIDQLQQGHDLRCQPPMSFSMAQSIFSGAQYVTLQKYFSHPSLVIYFFPTSPIRLKLGLQTGGRLLIATPPGPIKLSSQSIAGVRLCCAFYQLSKLCKFGIWHCKIFC
jgi:hypothetical protein